MPKDKSKYLNSVELKQNTITQKKFLTSKMSPGIQNTLLPSTSSSKEPEIMEMKLLVKEEINNAINLRQLYAVAIGFLEKNNIRTKLPKAPEKSKKSKKPGILF